VTMKQLLMPWLVGMLIAMLFMAAGLTGKWVRQEGCGHLEADSKDGRPVWCRQ